MYRVCVLSVAVWLGVVAMCHGQELQKCPPVDHRDANATLIANPYNCSTFYICRQGTPLLFVCPANLHFNDRLKVCDHQRSAGCVQKPATEPTPEVTKVTVTKVEKEVLVVKPDPEEAPADASPDAPSDDGLPSEPLEADEHETEPTPEVTKVTATKVEKEVLVVKPNPEEAPADVSPDAPSDDGLPLKPLEADEPETEPTPEVTKVTATKVEKEVLVVKPNPEEAPADVSPDAPSDDEHVDPVVGLL